MTRPVLPTTPSGLCGVCTHRRSIVSHKGSVFLLCGRSVEDPRFRRYPPLPVLSCPGFEASIPVQEPPA
jgi:hypothetical protein